MLRTVRFFTLIAFLLLPTISQAFDGNRQGFLVGIGGGFHGVDVDVESDTHSGLATSFRIGMGVTDRVLLYYLNNVSWYSRSGYTFTYGLSGFGASFYFNRSTPAVYLTSAVGYATYDDTDSNDSNFDGQGDGVGLMFGSGLELRRGLHLEAAVYHSSIEAERYVSEFDATTLQLLFNWIFY